MTAPTDPQTTITPPAADRSASPLATPTAATPTAATPPPLTPASARPPAPAAPPAAKPATNGCLKAFVIGTAVCLVLGIFAVGGLVMLGKKAADDIDKTFGVAAAQDYSLTVDRCDIDDFNNPKATGTIVNNSDHRQAYEIKIDFVDDANVKISNGVTFSGALDKGQRGSWSVPTFDDASGKTITCRVAEVSYTPFSG